MSDPVQITTDGAVTIIRLDDGKANAVTHELIAAISDGLSQAEQQGGAVLLLGRPGRFSAGFDLSVMSQGPAEAKALIVDGIGLLARMLECPLPIVAGCTGHALALGAMVLLAADLRIGAQGDFRLGLNEVAIGMTLPRFGVRLAHERLSRRHLLRSALLAEIYDPTSAVDAGYLDRVVPPEDLESEARAEAARLAALPPDAFAGTKHHLRAELAAGLRTDSSEFTDS